MLSSHVAKENTFQNTYFALGSDDKKNIDTGEVIPGQWRNEISELRNIEKYGGRKSTDMAKQMRNRLMGILQQRGCYFVAI